MSKMSFTDDAEEDRGPAQAGAVLDVLVETEG